MRLHVGLAVGLTLCALSVVPAAGAEQGGGGDDAVVVAVIDTALNPYHWDLAAHQMPQHRDADANNDLPLDAAPHTWLRGFPPPDTFGGYASLDLTLGEAPDAVPSQLYEADAGRWSLLEPSSAASVHYYWLPHTKVVGLVDFAVNKVHGTTGAHGSKVSSVSVGNLHGTCPECLLVFVSFETPSQGERALEWALAQPWIDAIVNSYGFSSTSSTTRMRDRIYAGSDIAAQRGASERGQTVFFSAGNGLQNDFFLPNTTYFSSQEGPDWTITVGATSATGHSYSGAGKPVDVSAPGDGEYPSMGGATVTSSSGFGGTSNATPVVAGLFGSALATARQRLDGPSRAQDAGVVATGPPAECGLLHPGCELGDGQLTARELRTRLLHAAVHTPQGLEVGTTPLREELALPEREFAAEGHGTFHGRDRNSEQWLEERARIAGPLDGDATPLARPDGEAAWFVADSYCRQQIWGTWADGDWRPGDAAPLPDPGWPLRSALVATCPAYQQPPRR